MSLSCHTSICHEKIRDILWWRILEGGEGGVSSFFFFLLSQQNLTPCLPNRKIFCLSQKFFLSQPQIPMRKMVHLSNVFFCIFSIGWRFFCLDYFARPQRSHIHAVSERNLYSVMWVIAYTNFLELGLQISRGQLSSWEGNSALFWGGGKSNFVIRRGFSNL